METVTFVFQGLGDRVGTVTLPWTKGKTVKLYMRESVLKEHVDVGAFLHRGRLFNARKERIRLSYEPSPGDLVACIGT